MIGFSTSTDEYTIASWLQWKITWSRSFPTLLPWIIFDHNLIINKEDVDDTDKQRKRLYDEDEYDDCVARLLQQLAFDEIFGADNNKRPPTTIRYGGAIKNTNQNDSTSPFNPNKEQLTHLRNYAHDHRQHRHNMSPLLPLIHDSSLGYGEITASAVFHVISWIRRDSNRQRHSSGTCCSQNDTNGRTPPRNSNSTIVLDLGSGNGKVLMASALAFPFARAIGYEIVGRLHDEALMHLSQWNRYHPMNSNHAVARKNNCNAAATATATVETISSSTVFEFYHADFRQCCGDGAGAGAGAGSIHQAPPNWLHHVQLVWVHATVFDEPLMNSVQQICESCPDGTYFAMVSKALSTTTSRIQTRGVLQLPMSWGQATVYIQRKRLG